MSRPDEDAQLAGLLRALSAPQPSAEFMARARRRYLEAIDARDRRRVLIGLGAALVGLGAIAILLAATTEPTALVAWLGEAAADLARWATGVGVVVTLVPLVIWTSAVLGSATAVLALVLIARGGSLALVK